MQRMVLTEKEFEVRISGRRKRANYAYECWMDTFINHFPVTHEGWWRTHTSVNTDIIGSGDDLPPVQRQTITWTLYSVGP